MFHIFTFIYSSFTGILRTHNMTSPQFKQILNQSCMGELRQSFNVSYIPSIGYFVVEQRIASIQLANLILLITLHHRMKEHVKINHLTKFGTP